MKMHLVVEQKGMKAFLQGKVDKINNIASEQSGSKSRLKFKVETFKNWSMRRLNPADDLSNCDLAKMKPL